MGRCWAASVNSSHGEGRRVQWVISFRAAIGFVFSCPQEMLRLYVNVLVDRRWQTHTQSFTNTHAGFVSGTTVFAIRICVEEENTLKKPPLPKHDCQPHAPSRSHRSGCCWAGRIHRSFDRGMEDPALHWALQKLEAKGDTLRGRGSNSSSTGIPMLASRQRARRAQRLENGHGSWKNTPNKIFFEVKRDPGPCPQSPFDSAGRGRALPALEDVLRGLAGAREGNAWYTEALEKSSQGKQVVRTCLAKHKAWK